MPAEKIARPVNRKHRAFCQAVSTGMQPSHAYRRYVSKPNDPRTAYERASVLCRRYSPYIGHLQNKVAEAAESAFVAGRVRLGQYLTRAVFTPPGNMDEYCDTVQEFTKTETDAGTVTKLRAVNKLDAVAQLCKLQGLDAPQQIQVNHLVLDSPALQRLQTLRNNRNATVVESIATREDSASATDAEWTRVQAEDE